MRSGISGFIAACVGCLIGAAVAHAAPIDVTSNGVRLSYDSSSDTLTVAGFTITFDVNGTAPPDYNISQIGPSNFGEININMTVNPSNNTSTGGTISLTGKINTPAQDSNPNVPPVTATSGTLLTGNITSFDFPASAGGTVFDFFLTVTGGDLASLYGGIGAHAETTVNAFNDSGGATPFPGNFNSSFSNTSNPFSDNGVSDTFAVPEPMSLSMIILSLLGFSAVRVRVSPRR